MIRTRYPIKDQYSKYFAKNKFEGRKVFRFILTDCPNLDKDEDIYITFIGERHKIVYVAAKSWIDAEGKIVRSCVMGGIT